MLVIPYYLLRDWGHLWESLIQLVPLAYKPDVRRLYEEIADVWRAYLRGQLLLMAVGGTLTRLGSAAIGLPGAAAFGLLTGLLDLIPSFGPVTAALIAAIVGWSGGSTYLPLPNFWFVVIVIVLYGSVQLIEMVRLQPRIIGHSLRLHPGLVFVGVVGSLALGGALLALISAPLLGSALVLGRYLHRRMLGLDPWEKTANHAAIGPDQN
jgi:predicted PurR-regulated permease PerM